MATWYGVPRPSFQPAARVITNITNSSPAIVTTGINHLFIDGMIVRLDVPVDAGMSQANHRFGLIEIIDDTNFSITVDTTQYDAFILTANPTAQAVPFAEDNSILRAAVQNVLPGNSI